MRCSFAAAVALFLLCLIGCEQPVTEGGKPNPRPVNRIVSLSPNTTELISLCMTNQIEFVGRTTSCDFPEFVKQVPVVGDVKPNYEKLAAAKPDLIVFDKSLYSDVDIAQIKRAAPNALQMPMDVNTLDEFVDYSVRLGSAARNETDVSLYLDKVHAARSRASGGKPATSPKILVMLGGSGAVYAAGTESFLADIVKIAGGTPIGPAGEKFAPMEPEAVIAANPDAIVCSVAKSQVIGDARFASLAAIKNGRVFSIKPEVLTRLGIRVDGLIDDISKVVIATAQQVKK